MMKKILATMISAMLMTTSVLACPAWECNYDLDDYSCGGVHGGCVTYDESSVRQPIYCQYCGHEMWDCVCGTYSYEDYEYAEDCGYSAGLHTGCVDNCDYVYDGGSNQGWGYSECSDVSLAYDYGYVYADTWDNECVYDRTMSHWANVRDGFGNIIGQIGCGSSVEVVGIDCNNPDRVMVYDSATGIYGSVLSECVYGGYSWDGTGDNGYYNQYRGGYEDEWDCAGYSDCDYDYSSCGYGNQIGCTYASQCAVVEYVEVLTIIKKYESVLKGCGLL